MSTPLLDIRDVAIAYGRKTVVDHVDLRVDGARNGLALIGESGSGKTTIARAVLGLVPVASGTISVAGHDIAKLDRTARAVYRRTVQPVFQDGTEVLDPRRTIRASLLEALRVTGSRDEQEVIDLLERVGVPADAARRHPHELSGGQRQRVAIARALATKPQLLVLDEPTSALDVTVQARVLDMFAQLRDSLGLAFLLITHNLAIVEHLCDEAAVISGGRIVESGPTRQVLADPQNDYTKHLIASVPTLDLD